MGAILERSLHRLRHHNVNDSAAIVIENKTGRVLAYVGAAANSKFPHVDGVIARRQAGSALKPLLYTRGLDTKTVTPASILFDDPTAISWSGECIARQITIGSSTVLYPCARLSRHRSMSRREDGFDRWASQHLSNFCRFRPE